MIWLAKEVVHLVSDSVELGRRKLWIGLHLDEKSSRHNIDAPLSYRYTNNHFLKVRLRKLHGWLLYLFQERYYEGEFEIFAKVLKFLALRITYVETLREDSADVPIMFPYKILHIVRQAHLSSDRILSKDVIDLLIGRQRNAEDVSGPQRIQKVKRLWLKVVWCRAIFIFNPIVLYHSPTIKFFAKHWVFA